MYIALNTYYINNWLVFSLFIHYSYLHAPTKWEQIFSKCKKKNYERMSCNCVLNSTILIDSNNFMILFLHMEQEKNK